MTTSTTGSNHRTAEQVALRSIQIMVNGTPEDFEEIVHPQAVNREAKDEPPACREPGPAGFYATALWLRRAFADLAFDVHEVVAQDDLVVVHNTMSGRHVEVFVSYDAEGRAHEAFPPTGRTFASTQSHWLRVRDGQVIEHWANRDDIGTALQLGWIPPSPLYLIRGKLALRRARQAAR